ncbi:sugar ABC transporter substrate-binding protein [Gordoniibacillus kamchatkensis]|uniref:Sugar ABC transporter substrate-binding protein n=1 Tax=Gordoniibacillus kamchatkensis TaxID=1590651 RepID=A0ABR5ADP1_9BACL|nr:sugar ABC transporter substrate-binding protein [Paenibacillus sp. VKM B-2647]KIL39124.1 sugar ABC transporter substrate-binding protein [Paenibacillus sp. VKM B-2647]
MKKTYTISAALLLSMAMAATGCGSKPSGNASQAGAQTGSDQPYKGQQISVLLEGHSTSNSIQKMLPDFEKSTGIKVNLEIVPYSDLTSKALMNFSSRSGRYDIVMDDMVHGISYVNAGYVDPLDSYAGNSSLNKNYDGADFVPQYLKAMKVGDKLYGLPVYGESTFLMYRKDLFEKYNLKVPTTFDEMMNDAKVIHDETKGEIAGITLRGEQGIQNVYVWATFLWGFGGQWINANGKSDLATPEAAKALNFYKDILTKYGPTGVANFGWQENRLLFQQGKAAMTIDATVNGAFNEDPKESSVVGKVGYAPVPTQTGNPKGGASSLAVHGMYLAKDSKNKEAAWLFMSWATSKDQQIKSMSIDPNSGVSSLSAMKNEVFLSKFGAFKDTMLAAIEKGNPNYLPQIPQANEIINNTGVAISKALTGHTSAEQALKEANDLNNKVLEAK